MVSTFSLSTRYRLYAEKEKMTATKNKTAKIPVVMFSVHIIGWSRKKLQYAAMRHCNENNFYKSRIKVYLLSEASDNKGR